MNPMLYIDGYKADHRSQYPKGTEYVYSNFTPRQSRVKDINEIIFFGLQYFIKEYLIERWNKDFFLRSKDKVVAEYKKYMDNYLGPDAIDCQHIADLHDLGYLPIMIKALPEGTKVPIGIPVLTIINTIPEFFWVTNYLETLMSAIFWKPTTSATTAFQYRKVFEEYAKKTGYSRDFIKWQGHDFSNRGMSGMEDAMMSSAGHLLSFTGTDTVSAIKFLEKYYNADCGKELIGGSVPATEHSTMCMGQKESELDTFRRLITKVYPKGIVSIVSDTWDFWRVITEYLPALKEEILARDGRVVIRPDSGDPVDIICGVQTFEDGTYNKNGVNTKTVECEKKGAIECLWDIFGGTINERGYKELNPKIGLIYGDSITLDRQKEILSRLTKKGFSANNLVLGIGSYTYEYVTRDTFGFAMKATWGQVNGEARDIFKDPKTDNGFKKSAKGLLRIYSEDGVLKCQNECTWAEEKQSLLQPVFMNGNLIIDEDLKAIRARIESYLV